MCNSCVVNEIPVRAAVVRNGSIYLNFEPLPGGKQFIVGLFNSLTGKGQEVPGIDVQDNRLVFELYDGTIVKASNNLTDEDAELVKKLLECSLTCEIIGGSLDKGIFLHRI